MLNLYLKRESNGDVSAHREPECQVKCATWNKFASNKPDKRYKTVMFNCYRWNIIWID